VQPVGDDYNIFYHSSFFIIMFIGFVFLKRERKWFTRAGEGISLSVNAETRWRYLWIYAIGGKKNLPVTT